MAVIVSILMLAGALPLGLAWRWAHGTTLRPTLAWTMAAWMAWSLLLWRETFDPNTSAALLRYLALSLTACAGIAVLGARRPSVGAWNFVVAGLLLVLLLPIAEGFGEPRLLGVPLLFFCAVLAVSVLNYLPTRLGLAVAAAGLACGQLLASHDKLGRLRGPVDFFWLAFLAAAPWLGWLGLRWRKTGRSVFDAAWRDFRDKFGLFWGLRVRDQFNRAAQNAGWPVVLRWPGLQRMDPCGGPSEAELLATLQALLTRFGRPKQSS